MSAASHIIPALPRPLLASEVEDVALIMGVERIDDRGACEAAYPKRHRELPAARPSKESIFVPYLDGGGNLNKIGSHKYALHGFERVARTGKFLTQIKPTQPAFTPNSAVTIGKAASL